MTERTYLRVEWLHSFPDEPIELLSELDADRFELRKIEIWADGRVGYAAPGLEHGGTQLGLEPVPPLEDIGTDPQFRPQPMSADDFEQQWSVKVRLADGSAFGN